MSARYFLVFILLLFASFAQAEVYQWVAEDGSVTYKDTPPPAAKKKKKVRVYRESDFAVAPPVAEKPVEQPGNRRIERPLPPAEKKTRFSGTVEIFVTGWCGYCRKAQQYMREKGIQYVAYDIEKDSAAKDRFKSLGGNGVPLILIGSNRMSGFSPANLEYYLNNSR